MVSLPTGTIAQSVEQGGVSDAVLAPTQSLRPDTRPGETPAPSIAEDGAIAAAVPEIAQDVPPAEDAEGRRPGGLAGLFRPRDERLATGTADAESTLAVIQSLRPELRPDGLEARVRGEATRDTPSRVTQPGRSTGNLCGVVGLQGDQIAPVTGRINGCGIPDNAVRLRVVHGITLTSPATINCNTAQSLSQWVLDAEDIVGNTGGGMANLRVVASYACRTRNSRSGARLSEHATGNAVDIAGIGLQNGSELSVLSDWRSGNSGVMRGLHEAACGTFGTVLGPESDRFHQDHFHFDVASYRSGAYCR